MCTSADYVVNEGEAAPSVVPPWRDNDCRPPASLLVAGPGIEGEPDSIAPLRDVGCALTRARPHASAPALSPQLISLCALRGVIRASKSSSFHSFTAGLT